MMVGTKKRIVMVSVAAIAVVGAAVALARDKPGDGQGEPDSGEEKVEEPPVTHDPPAKDVAKGSSTEPGKGSLRPLEEAAAKIAEAKESEARIRQKLAEEGHQPGDYVLRREPNGMWRVGFGYDDREPLLPDVTTRRELFFTDPEVLRDTADTQGMKKQGEAARQCSLDFTRRGGKVNFPDGEDEAWCRLVITVSAENGIGRVTNVETRPAWCAAQYDEQTAKCLAAAYAGTEFSASHDYTYRLEAGFVTVRSGETP